MTKMSQSNEVTSKKMSPSKNIILIHSLLHTKSTASIKKSLYHVHDSYFLHFFIHNSPAMNITSISGSFEHLTTNQSQVFHSTTNKKFFFWNSVGCKHHEL